MHAAGTTFVGRAAELATLRQEAAQAWQGRGRMVVVEGAAGIGKTRLVDELLRDRRGPQRRGQADDLRGQQPFSVIVEALGIDLRKARIGRLLHSAAERVADALLSHVEDLAAQGPVTLVLEDLHWSDQSTLVFLHLLEGQISGWPLLVVTTHRPGAVAETDRLLNGLGRRAGSRVVLGPLPDGDVRALAREALGGEPGPLLQTHLVGASGNPLFVTELLDAVHQAGEVVYDTPGVVDLASGSFPGSVGPLILQRLRLLPPESFALLQTAAVLGVSFSVSHLCRLTGLGAVDAGHRLHPALTAGVLVEASGRLAFRHEVIREALYVDVPEPLRRRLHLDAADALATAGAPAEELGEHLLRGASPDDPEAVTRLADVATRLVARVPSLAADVLQRAVELAPNRRARQRLLGQRAEALWRAGRLPEAEAACRSLLNQRPDPTVNLCLTEVLVAQSRLGEALAASHEGLTTGEASPGVRARLLAWSAFAGMYSGDLEAAVSDAVAARAAADATGDPAAEVAVLTAEAALAHLHGRFNEAIDLARHCLWLERDQAAEHGHVPVEILMAAFLLDAGRLEECREVIGAAMADCAERGSRWELAHCHWLAALSLFLSGQWDAAEAELDAAAVLADDLGTPPDKLFGLAIRARIALHRGDLPGARAAIATAERVMAAHGPEHRMEWLSLAQALLAEAERSPAEARDVAWSAWERCVAAGIASEFPVLAPVVVRLSLLVGDRASAEMVLAVLSRLEDTAKIPIVDAAALLCRSLVNDDPDGLAEAARRYRREGRPFEAARGAEECGRRLAAAGREEEARAQFDDALSAYRQLAATHDARRVAAHLRDIGVRPRRARSDRPQRPAGGWESLTPTETKVTALVAEGLSNPQIAERLYISRHTVHTHVSHILKKLGLSSRVELAREAARRTG
ncbi:MAG TPA: AAA family ATPase [Acidimicrobiia bacterium]|nr:AAA family ATPase [Acidimicrobiia bacterium]